MELGSRIRSHRLALGLTQESLARICFTTRQTIANWEKGKTLPDIQSLTYLSAASDTTIDDLINEDAPVITRRASADRRELLILYLVSFLISLINVLVTYYEITRDYMLLLHIVCLLSLAPICRRINALKSEHTISTIQEIAAYLRGYSSTFSMPRKGPAAFIIKYWYVIWFTILGIIYISCFLPLYNK